MFYFIIICIILAFANPVAAGVLFVAGLWFYTSAILPDREIDRRYYEAQRRAKASLAQHERREPTL